MLRASASVTGPVKPDSIKPDGVEARHIPLRERLVVPCLFCLALLSFNLGLRSLAPAQPVVTRLPFTMTSLDGWTPLSGDWVWDGALRQLDGDTPQALVRSPLQLSADNARLHVQMSDGAGLGFLLQDPKSLKAGHIAYVVDNVLSVGYMSALGAFGSDFVYQLPKDATVSLQLDTDSYAVLVNHDLVTAGLPLRHQSGFVTLLAQGEADISGLLVEAGGSVASSLTTGETP